MIDELVAVTRVAQQAQQAHFAGMLPTMLIVYEAQSVRKMLTNWAVRPNDAKHTTKP